MAAVRLFCPGTLCCNNHPGTHVWVRSIPPSTVTPHLPLAVMSVTWPLLLGNSPIPRAMSGLGSVMHFPTSALGWILGFLVPLSPGHSPISWSPPSVLDRYGVPRDCTHITQLSLTQLYVPDPLMKYLQNPTLGIVFCLLLVPMGEVLSLLWDTALSPTPNQAQNVYAWVLL